MDKIEILHKRIAREISARKQAEQILEEKSQALYDSNQKLLILASELERKIEARTKDLKAAKHKAEKAQKAEQEFMANMSHEIRTPLNAIIGMTHLLNATDMKKDQKEYVKILLNSSNLLLKLISDVLDFSKIDAGQIKVNHEIFDLKSLVKDIWITFNGKGKLKNNFIDCHIDENICDLFISDELIINQILTNLVGNAEKFTSKGSILINVKLLTSKKKYQKILFEIKDTGVGISKNEQKRIFKAFKQANINTSKNFGGTGLGLKISQKLANLLNSKIKVKSELGTGSCFYFKLNLKKGSKDNYRSIEYIDPEKISFNNKTILVVEDNLTNQKYISTLLNNWNTIFDIAKDGFEAVDKCNEKKFDLILMDIEMPKMNGFEAFDKLKKSGLNTETKVLALSASSTMSMKNKALKKGMSGFLSKPFTPEQLKNDLYKYLELKVSDQYKNTKLLADDNDKKLKKLLKKNYDNNISFAIEIFKDFLNRTDQKFVDMDLALKSNKSYDFRKIVHEITPTFQMVGLDQLTKISKEILKSTDADTDINKLRKYFEKYKATYFSSKGVVEKNLKLLRSLNIDLQ